MRRTDTLIAGGGPAGAAAAIMLVESGMRPLLLERSTAEHDVVCGGFMSWDTLAALDRVGIDAHALGAQKISHFRLVTRRRSVTIALPFAAAGLSRRALDTALLLHAAQQGVAVERGATIKRIDIENRIVALSDGGEIGSNAIFLATGKHELRGAIRPAKADEDPPVGIRTRLMLSPHTIDVLRDHIELFLFDRGYAGLLLQEDGSANLCMTVAQSRLNAAGGDPASMMAALAEELPLLGDRIAAASSIDGWATIARVPYGWRARSTVPGLFRIGDQAAVIASLAGDGIAIALTSGCLAAKHYLRNGPSGAQTYQTSFAKNARWPLWFASTLRKFAETPPTARIGVGMMASFPGIARTATRLTRIGGY